jgi:hypothetical protein
VRGDLLEIEIEEEGDIIEEGSYIIEEYVEEEEVLEEEEYVEALPSGGESENEPRNLVSMGGIYGNLLEMKIEKEGDTIEEDDIIEECVEEEEHVEEIIDMEVPFEEELIVDTVEHTHLIETPEKGSQDVGPATSQKSPESAGLVDRYIAGSESDMESWVLPRSQYEKGSESDTASEISAPAVDSTGNKMGGWGLAREEYRYAYLNRSASAETASYWDTVRDRYLDVGRGSSDHTRQQHLQPWAPPQRNVGRANPTNHSSDTEDEGRSLGEDSWLPPDKNAIDSRSGSSSDSDGSWVPASSKPKPRPRVRARPPKRIDFSGTIIDDSVRWVPEPPSRSRGIQSRRAGFSNLPKPPSRSKDIQSRKDLPSDQNAAIFVDLEAGTLRESTPVTCATEKSIETGDTSRGTSDIETGQILTVDSTPKDGPKSGPPTPNRLCFTWFRCAAVMLLLFVITGAVMAVLFIFDVLTYPF